LACPGLRPLIERCDRGPERYGGPDDACWTAQRDRLLIGAVDALHDTSDVPGPLWEQLAAEFSEAELLDLLMLCGWYHAISFAARATRLELESWAPAFLSHL
jgi:hypothetical protein